MMIFIGFFIGVLGIYLWILLRKRERLSLYMVEPLLKTEDPVPLVGKPDIVWRNGRGKLIVGDYKSRKNKTVYPSEVIQLSVYKFLLERTQKYPVESYGFIHFDGGYRKKIKLLKEKEVISLYHRYIRIITGRIHPCLTGQRGYCQYCTHRKRCRR